MTSKSFNVATGIVSAFWQETQNKKAAAKVSGK